MNKFLTSCALLLANSILVIVVLVAFGVMSLPAQASTQGKLAVATGSEGGGYERLGNNISAHITVQAKKAKLGVVRPDVLNTTGSVKNIELFNSNEAQIIIVQQDALALYPINGEYKSKPAMTEAIHWFANTKNGYSDFSDVEGVKDVLIVIVDGSGASVTCRTLCRKIVATKSITIQQF